MPSYPEDESAGKRKVPFSKVLYIEQDDFAKFLPSSIIAVSRTRGALALRLFHHRQECGEERSGEIVEVHCTYDPATRGAMLLTDAK